ncbi:hypothetical protein [Streptomonospora sp. PA3]|uniref:hypothetical protein n=1 Tax=Streptomonospora sp. PA3 TaxID=2607326 RepID=UPI0031BB2127
MALEATKDPSAGWNVHLDVERYAFTPGRVGGRPRQGEGHAHLYVDGEKIARVYGPWHHVPASAVGQGEHTLSVRLSANDHSTWAVGGEPISDSTAITGGGPAGDAAAAPAPEADTTLEITLDDGAVSPEPGRVEAALGDRVRITVRSDTTETVHLHGYDIERSVAPGQPAVLEFTAETSGLFELEAHESGTLLTQIAVR